MLGSKQRTCLVVLAAIAGMYVAYPYVTLFRLGLAIQQGDAATLETMVDWDRVRDGIKEDICDAVLDDPTPAATNAEALPAFGTSFMRGIAGSMIDKTINAASLVQATRSMGSAPDYHRVAIVGSASAAELSQPVEMGAPRVVWAFFENAKTFDVEMKAPTGSGIHHPIRVQMELVGTEWKIIRAWLPMEMLAPSNART
jgi:hypothetical protein